MKSRRSRSHTALSNASRVVDRGIAPLNEPPRGTRYGQSSGLVEPRITRSAALTEAARRVLRMRPGS